MIRRLRALLAALVLASALPAQAADAVADESRSIVRRTTLLVHDLDASKRFYRDYLGFTLWYQGEPGTVTGNGLPVADAEVGEPTRFVIMKGRDPYVGMVGLLQYGHAKPLPDIAAATLKAGDAILMIEVTGIADIAARMAADGYPVHKLPTETRVKSVSDSWRAAFMYVFDPDGHMVELTERLAD